MKNWMKPAAAFAAAALCLAASPPTKPLPVTTITIDSDHGPIQFSMEIAADTQSQEYGLMNRKVLAPNAGMLFDFHEPGCESFWMKDTILPLDMLFVRADGTISSIAENAVPFSTTPISSLEPVRAVIEINGGRTSALGIVPGNKVHAAIFNAVIPKDAPLRVCR